MTVSDFFDLLFFVIYLKLPKFSKCFPSVNYDKIKSFRVFQNFLLTGFLRLSYAYYVSNFTLGTCLFKLILKAQGKLLFYTFDREFLSQNL